MQDNISWKNQKSCYCIRMYNFDASWFLLLFLQMFKSHTHKYSNLPPCPDEASENLERTFGSTGGVHKNSNYVAVGGVAEQEIVSKTFSGLSDKLLSKHIRIN